MAQPETSTPDVNEHVLTASGEFDVRDAPIDIGVYRFEDWIAFVFFWALSAVIFLQFFTRYALNDSASWTEEIARYLLICTVFIGAAIGVRKNNHIQVDFLYRVLPKPLMRVMSVFVDATRIAFLAYATWLTFQLLMRIGGQQMSVIDLPIGLVYSVVLVGFALMTWRAIDVAIANWRRKASVLEKPELAESAT
jgi:TRAP-type C4-dicarboxylate transport system permease small subunit